MKKIITEESVKVEMWESEDGRLFKSEEECAKHERRTTLRVKIDKVPHDLINHNHFFSTGGCDDALVMFHPRNIGEADTLCTWCVEYNVCNPYTVEGMVGKTLVIDDAYTGTEYAGLDDIDPDYLYGTLQTLDDYIGDIYGTLHYYEKCMLDERKEN